MNIFQLGTSLLTLILTPSCISRISSKPLLVIAGLTAAAVAPRVTKAVRQDYIPRTSQKAQAAEPRASLEYVVDGLALERFLLASLTRPENS